MILMCAPMHKIKSALSQRQHAQSIFAFVSFPLSWYMESIMRTEPRIATRKLSICLRGVLNPITILFNGDIADVFIHQN